MDGFDTGCEPETSFHHGPLALFDLSYGFRGPALGRPVHSKKRNALLLYISILRSDTADSGHPASILPPFQERAERVMPRIQTWIDSNGWVINEVVILFFIVILFFG
jgi:hypothetical protein